jgi:hypothetical protein
MVGCNSAYLYGSVPRGTATVGVSDFDALLVFVDHATPTERAETNRIEAALDRDNAEISGAGILISDTHTVLSELERFDLPRQPPTLPPTRTPQPTRSTDGDTLGMILDDFAPWLVAEYDAVHGTKAPRIPFDG